METTYAFIFKFSDKSANNTILQRSNSALEISDEVSPTKFRTHGKNDHNYFGLCLKVNLCLKRISNEP